MSGVLKQIHDAGSESILFAHKAFDLLQKKSDREALELCEEGIKRFPFYVEGHYMLARCYQALDRNEAAIAEYETVLHYMPGHLKALKALIWLYLKQGKQFEAHQLLQNFALYDPLNAELIQFLKTNGLYRVLSEPAAPEDKEIPVEKEETLESGFDEELKDDLFDTREPVPPFEEVPVLNLDGDDLPPLDTGMDSGNVTEPALPPETDLQSDDESMDDQEQYERNNIVNNIDEQESAAPPLNLDRFDNTADDFSTVMDDVFQKPSDEEEIPNEDETEDNAGPTEDEPEALAEERPMLDTTMIFNEEKQEGQAVEGGSTVNDFDNLAAELESQSFDEAAAIEESMVEAPPFEDSDTEKFSSGPEEQPPEKQEESLTEKIAEAELEPESAIKPEEVIPAANEAQVPASDAEISNGKEQVDEAEKLSGALEDDQVSVEEILSNPSLLTPTFGEILIAQKKFEDARQVFIELSKREPENVRFKKKVEFLNKLVAMDKRN